MSPRTPVTVQSATYFLGVCLFSISFLVFLNSTISFVITDVIGIKRDIGDLVGTLGFVDELVALAACPLWGLLSDVVGARLVCVVGYTIIGLALCVFVQAKNVYPQLLLLRVLFSVGGAATATMVTAILPSIVAVRNDEAARSAGSPATGPSTSEQQGAHHSMSPSLSSELTITPARLARMPIASKDSAPEEAPSKPASPTLLAGFVGLFTGCGALLALAVFLPLPARLQAFQGVSPAQAVRYSYYVVGCIAFLVAIGCLLGLRSLAGENGHRRKNELGVDDDGRTGRQPGSSSRASRTAVAYRRALFDAAILGFGDSRIGLGYVGGFVARASSVGISLFIPLFVNAYFISSGLCTGDPNGGTEEMKRECRRAYVLAAELTGVSQLVALVFAPVFGYVSDRWGAYNIPLLAAAVAGIIGHIAFGMLHSPEAGGKSGSPTVFLIVALQGISQIGCIVCSLGLLGQGIINDDVQDPGQLTPSDEIESVPHVSHANGGGHGDMSGSSNGPSPSRAYPVDESTRLLQFDGEHSYPPHASSSSNYFPPSRSQAEDREGADDEEQEDDDDDFRPPSALPQSALLYGGGLPTPTPPARSSPFTSPNTNPNPINNSNSNSNDYRHLKGSIAGVYSLVGGAAILLLTKLGGYLFDRLSPATPFYMLAIFNGVLLSIGLAVNLFSSRRA